MKGEGHRESWVQRGTYVSLDPLKRLASNDTAEDNYGNLRNSIGNFLNS